MVILHGRNALIFALLGLVLLQAAFAVGDYSVDVEPIQPKISIEEIGSYFLIITNNLGYKESFQIYSPSVEWGVHTNPLLDEIVEIPDGQSRRVKIEFIPTKYVVSGRQYGIQMNVRARAANILKKNYALLTVKSPQLIAQEYQPAIDVEVEYPQEIDPRKKYQLKLDIENKNVLNIEELQIIVDSDTVHQESMTSLGPLKQKTVLFTLAFDPVEAPLKDHFKIRTFAKNRTTSEDILPYQILAIDDVQEKDKDEKTFMKTIVEVSLRNEGNINVSKTFNYPVSWYEWVFVYADKEKHYERMNGQGYYVFPYSLEPLQVYKIRIVHNYRIILYLIIAGLVYVVLYYLLRSPVVARKVVSSITTKEGAISEMKILLHVRNRTGKRLYEIIVADRAPKLVELVNEFSLGTLKPLKILQHETKGTIIKWYMDGLEPFEERVITYSIRARLNILGGVTLPFCIVKFKEKSGKEYLSHSNKLRVAVKREEI